MKSCKQKPKSVIKFSALCSTINSELNATYSRKTRNLSTCGDLCCGVFFGRCNLIVARKRIIMKRFVKNLLSHAFFLSFRPSETDLLKQTINMKYPPSGKGGSFDQLVNE